MNETKHTGYACPDARPGHSRTSHDRGYEKRQKLFRAAISRLTERADETDYHGVYLADDRTPFALQGRSLPYTNDRVVVHRLYLEDASHCKDPERPTHDEILRYGVQRSISREDLLARDDFPEDAKDDVKRAFRFCDTVLPFATETCHELDRLGVSYVTRG